MQILGLNLYSGEMKGKYQREHEMEQEDGMSERSWPVANCSVGFWQEDFKNVKTLHESLCHLLCYDVT